ncbi:MAG: hypothetical protein ACP5N3_04825 [Candidatus Nanoarchaeia archaeon]
MKTAILFILILSLLTSACSYNHKYNENNLPDFSQNLNCTKKAISPSKEADGGREQERAHHLYTCYSGSEKYTITLNLKKNQRFMNEQLESRTSSFIDISGIDKENFTLISPEELYYNETTNTSYFEITYITKNCSNNQMYEKLIYVRKSINTSPEELTTEFLAKNFTEHSGDYNNSKRLLSISLDLAINKTRFYRELYFIQDDLLIVSTSRSYVDYNQRTDLENELNRLGLLCN